MRAIHAFLTLSLAWFSAPALAAELPAGFLDDTREYLGRLERLGFGGPVVIAVGGETVLAEGYGLADREAGRRWTPETVSTVGSITKQFTGAAILLLQEDGKLRVEDTLDRYFPEAPADKRGITLHQLLTHSSGIVDLDGADDWDPIEREEFVRRSLAQDLAFAPGTSYAYSNAGYSLLGAVIEQLTGRSYETFVRERLFLPQGMRDTGYILAGWAPDRVAVGYDGDERWGTVLGRPIAADGPYWVLRANGGIHSTGRDMVRWAQALLAGRVLRPESRDALWAPAVDEGGGSFYGYGWSIQDRDGTRVITHNGGNGILFADLSIIPGPDLVVFLQTNGVPSFPGCGTLREHIESRYLEGTPYPALPDRVPASALSAVAGEYALPGGDRFVVHAGTEELRVEPRGWTAFLFLHSTRTPDAARADRLSRRIDAITRSGVAGDFGPLAEAYAGRVTAERLAARWEETLRDEAADLGDLEGYEVLGTALTPDRDITVVRYRFRRGHLDRAYVWDAQEEEHLLGVSRRGLDPELRFVPDASGGFASWDGGFRASVPLTFADGGDGSRHLVLAREVEAIRQPGE